MSNSVSFPKDLDSILELAIENGWVFNEFVWKRDGYKNRSTEELYNFLKGEKATSITDFENVVRPVIKYLCENHHPPTTIIITLTNAELLTGEKSTGEITDYVLD